MPEIPTTKSPWDFSEAIKILHSPLHEIQASFPPKPPRTSTPSKSLGDFSRIWQDLGKSPESGHESLTPRARQHRVAVKDYTIPNPNHPPAPPLRDETYASDGGAHQSARKSVRWKDEVEKPEETDDGPTTPTSEEEPTHCSQLTALFKPDSTAGTLDDPVLNKQERKRLKKLRQKEKKRLEKEEAEKTAQARKVFSDVESESEIKKLPRLSPATKASKHTILPPPPTATLQSTSTILPTNGHAMKTRSKQNQHQAPADSSDNGESVTPKKILARPRPAKDDPPSTPTQSSGSAMRAVYSGNLLPTSVPQKPRGSPAQELSRSLQSQYTKSVPTHIPVVTTPSKQPASQQVYPFHTTQQDTRASISTPLRMNPSRVQADVILHMSTGAANRSAADHGLEARHAIDARRAPYFTQPYYTQYHQLTPPHRPQFQILEKEERDFQLFLRLVHEFSEDKKWLTRPVPMANHNASPDGIHVFVDFSNIWIGFMDHLKNLQIQMRQSIPHQNLSFDSLVLLLERKRPVAKRVLAGSYPLLPAMELAQQIGYETAILEKVYKSREPTERQRRMLALQSRNSFAPLGTQGSSSSPSALASSSSPPKLLPSAPLPASEKWVEQGVDEILHLKILESIVDSDEPSTMVVATGDAAKAEYSEGFMKMIVRALKKGWHVELVAFSKSISGEYWKQGFQAEWEGQFTILCLDWWAQFLLDT
jgi:hypothetical protein